MGTLVHVKLGEKIIEASHFGYNYRTEKHIVYCDGELMEVGLECLVLREMAESK